MARWRLRNGHYLNTLAMEEDKLAPGTQWEYKEQDRGTGRAARKMYNVPQLLDPKDPADCNYPGEIIVCNEYDRAFPRDIIFLGDPTPEMEALDESAEAISDSLRHKWEHPIDTLPVNGAMNFDERTFMEKMMQSFAASIGAQLQPQAPANASVSKEEFDALKEQLAALQAQMASKTDPAAASTITRRG